MRHSLLKLLNRVRIPDQMNSTEKCVPEILLQPPKFIITREKEGNVFCTVCSLYTLSVALHSLLLVKKLLPVVLYSLILQCLRVELVHDHERL